MKLVAVLPYLAFAAMAVEPVAAHGPRHPRDRHAQLIRNMNKPVPRSALGAQERPRVIKRSDGTQCRVRPASDKPQDAPVLNAQTVTNAAPASSAPPAEDKTSLADQQAASSSESAAVPQESSAAPQETPAPQQSSAPEGNTSQDTPAASSAPQGDSQSQPPSSAESASATPEPTASAQPDNNNSVSRPSGAKAGYGWGNGPDQSSMKTMFTDRISWFYTWDLNYQEGYGVVGAEYVPHFHSPDDRGKWESKKGQWPSNTKHALFLNEPEESGQAATSAGSAVEIWTNSFLPGCRQQGFAAGSAATTNSAAGFQWNRDFDSICRQSHSDADCRADFRAIHWYGLGIQNTNLAGFQNDLTKFYQEFKQPVWVTEFGCQNYDVSQTHNQQYVAQCSKSDTWNFHLQVTQWMDSQDWIDRYASFAAIKRSVWSNQQPGNIYNIDNFLLDDSGPSDVGRIYAFGG